MSRVLILGAGLVAGPLVRYLTEVKGFQVTVATRTIDKAEKLLAGAKNGTAVSLDVEDEKALDALIAKHDLSISLLPYVYHPVVARLCVQHKKHMVTTSYVKDAMRALDGAARDARVILLNEIGVDPGVDHMSAMQIIHRIRDEGGTLVGFTSNTGGLPAPEANTNPMGYKFSWAPRGVVLAGKNPARFLKDGKIVDIPGPDLFAHHWTCHVVEFGDLEVYPNRDSLPYIDTYGIATVRDMFRGTLRYPGWCETLKAISDLGILDETDRADLSGLSFAQWTGRLLGMQGAATPRDLAHRLDLSADAKPVTDLVWLGLTSNDPLPKGATTYLDVLAQRMLSKMQYGPGERDMLIMQHEFVVRYDDRTERIASTLVDYGIPDGDTSMSRLVGLPAAIAARMVLQGEIDLTGVQVPTVPAVYEPVLEELATLGVRFTETTSVR